MTRDEKAIMIALVIGDGSLEKLGPRNVRLKIEHSIKQRDYVIYKRDLLHKIIGGKQIKIYTTNRVRKNTKLQSAYFRKNHRYFRVIRKVLYKYGKKQITKPVLYRLTPKALAIWYMDDGNLYKHIHKDKVTSFRITLSTEVSYEEALLIQEYFLDRWNIHFHINKTKNGRFRHRCSTKEARKFFDIIEPHIIDSMKYKIDVPNYIRHECQTPRTGEDIV